MKAHPIILTTLLAGLALGPVSAQEASESKKKPKKKPPANVVEADPFAADPFAADPPKKWEDLGPEQQRAELPKLIQVQCEWIEMDHETLTELMFGRDPKGDSTGLRKEVQDLVRKDRATIIETTICMCRPGQKAVTESIREHIYPTEYEPPEIPNEVNLGKVEPSAEALAQLVVPATPTAFETRNVGTTFEMEAILDAGGHVIDLRFAPEIVVPTGTAKWQTMKDGLGNENHVQMPLFYTMRISTGLTLRDGQYRLASVQSPQGDDGETDRSRKVMVFVKGDVVVIGEETIGK